tara:strand:+ start:96 stop:206 length:111 start_codon:yes stop_codon:yes gene_type:complete
MLNIIWERLNGANSINPTGLIIREKITPINGTPIKY